MDGETRRKEILNYIAQSTSPVSGTALAQKFEVSRQVIVQDIALLRATDHEILSTHRGYILQNPQSTVRVIHVCHTDEQMEEELNTVVDFGGTVVDVFIRHQVYGELRASLQISSRLKVRKFLEEIREGKSSPLKDLTSGQHYHTISADSDQTLDAIEKALSETGILVSEV